MPSAPVIKAITRLVRYVKATLQKRLKNDGDVFDISRMLMKYVSAIRR